VIDDLKITPWLGAGYRGNAPTLTIAESQHSQGPKIIEYRYESLWATVLSYYGILGAASLIVALVHFAGKLGWPVSIAGII
jgi:hypothetical protein